MLGGTAREVPPTRTAVRERRRYQADVELKQSCSRRKSEGRLSAECVLFTWVESAIQVHSRSEITSQNTKGHPVRDREKGSPPIDPD